MPLLALVLYPILLTILMDGLAPCVLSTMFADEANDRAVTPVHCQPDCHEPIKYVVVISSLRVIGCYHAPTFCRAP